MNLLKIKSFVFWSVQPQQSKQTSIWISCTTFLSDKSIIVWAPSSPVVLEGSNHTLFCNATGNPPPNITWTKDGSLTVLHQGEAYSIVNIQRQAAGNYKCTAWNGVGEPRNVASTVIVYCKYNQDFRALNLVCTLSLTLQKVFCKSFEKDQKSVSVQSIEPTPAFAAIDRRYHCGVQAQMLQLHVCIQLNSQPVSSTEQNIEFDHQNQSCNENTGNIFTRNCQLKISARYNID